MSDNPKMPRVINISNTPMDSRNAEATYWCGLSGGAIFANQTEYVLKSQADALAEALEACMKQVKGCCDCLAGTEQQTQALAAIAAYQEGE